MPRERAGGLRAWFASPFHRFAVALPAAIALIVGALFYPLFIEAEAHIREEVQAAIEFEIAGLEAHFHERGLAGLRDALQRRIEISPDRAAVYLLADRDGRALAGNLSQWPAGVSANDEAWFHVAEADGETLEGRVFILFGGERLLVGRRSPLEAFQRNMTARLWWSAALIILVAGVIGGRFMQHLHRRLARLAAEAGRIQEGHLAQRLSLSARGDELDALAERFNSAFDEIERLVDAAKHVSSAIAHDMRRPLIALRNAIDEARRSPGADPALRTQLEGLRDQTEELLRTFSALLSLARIEAGALGPLLQAVNLTEIVRDAIDLYEPLAASQGRALNPRLAPACVRGDRDLLFQVLQNLIENALKHGAGDIDIGVDTLPDGGARLTVRDHGEAVAAADLPHLFERFFRADSSRSAAEGAGIGLALVRGIAEAHGGSIRATDARPGLCVEILLAPGRRGVEKS
ncbi:putative two component sensor kinase [Azoarcus olearius]|uniref:sensor histidine kinase n=1 Tax=Azoarcus sp. (strain BH72) TaxID=418699 RepID=UPI00080628FD|nr:HAMP domain-containing sensor histidine kinase [Azoarcus olearius]ANQ83545.1 putative two component sensor kinase [Azoarcus olearius]